MSCSELLQRRVREQRTARLETSVESRLLAFSSPQAMEENHERPD